MYELTEEQIHGLINTLRSRDDMASAIAVMFLQQTLEAGPKS